MKIIVFELGFETFEMHLENFLVLGGMYFLCISNVAVIGVPVRNIGMFLLPLPGMQCVKHGSIHCVKIFRIWSFSDPYFPAFRQSTDQENSEDGDLSRRVWRVRVTGFYRHLFRNSVSFKRYTCKEIMTRICNKSYRKLKYKWAVSNNNITCNMY